jgi:predicted RNA-binding Zn ribbon-like protein
MFKSVKQEELLTLETGRLCLDFANTAEWHASDHPIEELVHYSDLVTWARTVGLLAEDEAQRLRDAAAHRPDGAAAMLDRAITLREALYRIFSAVAAGGWPHTDDLAVLNAALSEALAHLSLAMRADGFAWEWIGDEEALDQMLWPVARSAADLLTWEELDRVGECADDRGCGWLFIDTSKNHTRQYCGYSCANRAKAQRHYARSKASRSVDA